MHLETSIKNFVKKLLFEKMPICLLDFLKNRFPKIAKSYKDYCHNKELNKNLHKKGYEALAEFHKIMQQNKIDYWITAGTLLGVYREKKFIGHDLDIDTAIRSEDLFKTFTVLKNSKVTLLNCYYSSEGRLTELKIEINSVGIDIFVAYLEDHKECISVGYRDKENDSLKIATMFLPEVKEIVPVEIMGYNYMMPANTHEYLTAIYGPKYMIPDKTWVYTRDLYCAKYYSLDEMSVQCMEIGFLEKMVCDTQNKVSEQQ